jgi:hypothetical protein
MPLNRKHFRRSRDAPVGTRSDRVQTKLLDAFHILADSGGNFVIL